VTLALDLFKKSNISFASDDGKLEGKGTLLNAFGGTGRSLQGFVMCRVLTVVKKTKDTVQCAVNILLSAFFDEEEDEQKKRKFKVADIVTMQR
jgi:hypothetical protein